MTITERQLVKLNKLYTQTLEKLGNHNQETVSDAIAQMWALNEVFSILEIPTESSEYDFLDWEDEYTACIHVSELNHQKAQEEETPELFPGIKGMLDNISF